MAGVLHGVLHGVVAFFPGWAWLLCCLVAVHLLVGAVMRACGIGLAWLDMGSIPQSPELKRVKSCRKGYMRRPFVIVNPFRIHALFRSRDIEPRRQHTLSYLSLLKIIPDVRQSSTRDLEYLAPAHNALANSTYKNPDAINAC